MISSFKTVTDGLDIPIFFFAGDTTKQQAYALSEKGLIALPSNLSEQIMALDETLVT